MGVQQVLAGMFGMFIPKVNSKLQMVVTKSSVTGKELNLSKNEIIWKGWSSSVLPQTGTCRELQEGLKHLGIPMKGGAAWIFFFPACLGMNTQWRGQGFCLHTARAGVPYRHHLLPKNQPETPAAVDQCPQLPQVTTSSKAAGEGEQSPGLAVPWGARRPQHPHFGAAAPPPTGSVWLSWSSDKPWAGWRFVCSNDRSQEMKFLLLRCHEQH